MKKITLSFFFLISSFLGFSQINEGFEGATFPPTTPSSWAVFNNNTGPAVLNWTLASNNPFPPYTGANAAIIDRVNIGQGNTMQNWLVTPQITVTANNQLKFFSRLTNLGPNATNLEIRISTDPIQSNLAAYTTVQTWDDNTMNVGAYNIYEEKAINLSAYPSGTQLYIAFVKVHTQTGAAVSSDRWLIDDVQIVTQCLTPLAPNVLLPQLPNSANLTWTNPSGATQWEVEVVPEFSAFTGTGITVNTNPYVYGGLSPATTYEYKVRAICSPTNKSQWSTPLNFPTANIGAVCAVPINITALPFSQSSNTNLYGDDFDISQGTSCGAVPATTNYFQGDEVFYSYTATFTGNISINMTASGPSSSLFVYNGCANVGVSCLAGVANTATTVRTIPNLAVVFGQTYIIAISSSTTPLLGLPYNLVIQQVTCNPPTSGPVTNIGMTTANISWTGSTGATAWEVSVLPFGSPIPTGSGLSANTNVNFTYSGLTSGTAYEYWVRADCGNGTFSPWAGPKAFKTSVCEVADQCNYTFRLTSTSGGWRGALMEVRQNNVVVAILGADFITGVTRNEPVVLCQNYPFQLYWVNSGTTPANVGIQIINNALFLQTIYTKAAGTGTPSLTVPLYQTSINCSAAACLSPTGGSATAVTASTANLGWTAPGSNLWDVFLTTNPLLVPLATTTPTYAGVNTNPLPVIGLTQLTQYYYYVRVICTPGVENSNWSAPFTFTTLPTCPSPISLTTTSLTATSVILGWTNVVPATGWEVLALPCGTPAPTATSTGFVAVPTNPFTLSGLSAGTCYDLYVRSICTPTDTSPWSNKKTIITPPGCGSMFYDNGGPLGDYTVNTNNPTVNDIITIFPTNLGDKVTVTFQEFNIESSWDGLYVYNGNSTAAPQISSGNPAGFGTAMAMPGAFWGTTIPQPFTSTSADGSLTFVFKSDGSAQRSGWKALVTCNPPPTCAKPINLGANSITQTTANLNWSQPPTPGTASLWEIIVQPAILGNPTGNGIATTNPYNATGLLAGTSYEFYVRANCSVDGYSLWAGPYAFGTKVGNDECTNAIVVPVNDDASCALFANGSVIGATASNPNVFVTNPTTPVCASNIDDDVWFQFTATATKHYVNLFNIVGSTTNLNLVLYSGNCGLLTQILCLPNESSVMPNLIIGNTYYLRVYTDTTTPNQTATFNVCIGTISICETSEGLCADPADIKIFPNTVGVPSQGEIACLFTTPNPTYYYITVGVAGNINFEISQNTSYDTLGNPTGAGLDVDFVAWGPFTSNTVACGALSQGCPGPTPGGCQNNTTAPANYYPFPGTNIIDCSYSFLPVETFTINNAQVGQVYVVLITNYIGGAGSIKFTQLNQTIPPTPGSGASDCSIICNSNLGPDQNLCGFTSVVLNPQITNPDATFKWFKNGIQINLPPNTRTYTATESGTYKVITKCGLNEDPDTVVINFGPSVITADQPDYKVCDDQLNDGIASFSLNTLTPNIISGLDPNYTYNVSYHYTEANALANISPINPLVPYLGTTQTIYIRISGATAAFCNTVIPQNLVVVKSPIGTIASSDADNTICSNDSATITFTPTNFVATAASYIWKLNGVIVPTATTNIITPSATGTYEVTAILNGCVSQPTSLLFTVNPQPNFTLSDTNLIKCINEFATITVVPTNFSLTDPLVTYVWSLDGIVQPTLTLSTITVTAYGNYSVVISRLGCASLPKSKIVILDTADIPIGTSGDCIGSNYIITSTPINNSFNPSSTTVTYQWTNASGTIVGNNKSTFNVTEYVVANNVSPSSFPTSFTVKITTIPDGCTDTQTFEVKSASCVVQKGLSPNGDGSNDSFDLRGLDVKQLSVFNRYGTKIYSQANYKDEWRGQNSKSENSPVGTYYYVIELNNGETKTGWVYLNR